MRGPRGVTPQKQPRSMNKEPEAEFQVTAEGEMGNHSVNVLLSAALYTGKQGTRQTLCDFLTAVYKQGDMGKYQHLVNRM